MSGLQQLEGQVYESLAQYLKEREIPWPETWSLKSRCKPEFEKLEEMMTGQITKLKDHWKMQKKKLPWAVMKGFNLTNLVVKGRPWWDQYEKMYPEAMEANLLHEIKPLKEMLTFTPVDKKKEHMSIMGRDSGRSMVCKALLMVWMMLSLSHLDS